MPAAAVRRESLTDDALPAHRAGVARHLCRQRGSSLEQAQQRHELGRGRVRAEAEEEAAESVWIVVGKESDGKGTGQQLVCTHRGAHAQGGRAGRQEATEAQTREWGHRV